MNHPTRYMVAALSTAVLAALTMMTGTTAAAGPLPGLPSAPADGLLPSPQLPALPPLPIPSLNPPAPVPHTSNPPPATDPRTTPPNGLPGLTGSPAASTARPPAGATATEPNALNTAATVTAADGIIADDPAADLYPQPQVDPATTAQSRLVARLDQVQHRVQYLHNILARTRADLAVAQAQLDSVSLLITLLTAPAAPTGPASAAAPATVSAPSGGALDGPQGRVLALSAAIASGEAELARTESAAQSLQQQVNDSIREALTSDKPVPASPATSAGGKLRRPVSGPTTSRFGNRLDPYYHVWQLHAGMDIAAPAGTPIVAAATGRVTQAGWAGGYGRYTCIEHGQFNGQRLTTCYAHQQAILVEPGQQVSVGQVIGRVGSTGASTGPHLHFEVRLGGRPVDPMPWI
jgi:murein DD-endopeptidase MepM/ murein hydrolase activator NlpD